MPLVRIDVHQVYSVDQTTAIANEVHEAIVEVFGIPERDKFQVVNRLAAGSLVAEDAGLGFERTSGVVVIQIFTQRGRATDLKQRLYKRIAERLAVVGVAGEDVFIGYVENGPEDWSFGYGKAQYLTGELAIPSSRS